MAKAEQPRDRGLLLVVSSPSGAGKTTLCRRLIEEFPRVRFSISYTTRPRRGKEQHGIDYNFVDEAAFSKMVDDGQFAEWAEVHGNRYGTAWSTLRENVECGHDVIFDIDWQGGEALKQNPEFGPDTVMIFILPPSMHELARRLKGRGTDAPEVVERRLAKAKDELRHFRHYHYLVVNDELTAAYNELRAVYIAARCESKRRGLLVEAFLEADRD